MKYRYYFQSVSLPGAKSIRFCLCNENWLKGYVYMQAHAHILPKYLSYTLTCYSSCICLKFDTPFLYIMLILCDSWILATNSISVEINTEILKCMFITYHQNKRQIQYTGSSKWYEKIAKFKWVGTTVTNQIYILPLSYAW